MSCVNCSGSFDDDVRLPCQLECGHRMCSQCRFCISPKGPILRPCPVCSVVQQLLPYAGLPPDSNDTSPKTKCSSFHAKSWLEIQNCTNENFDFTLDTGKKTPSTRMKDRKINKNEQTRSCLTLPVRCRVRSCFACGLPGTKDDLHAVLHKQHRGADAMLPLEDKRNDPESDKCVQTVVKHVEADREIACADANQEQTDANQEQTDAKTVAAGVKNKQAGGRCKQGDKIIKEVKIKHNQPGRKNAELGGRHVFEGNGSSAQPIERHTLEDITHTGESDEHTPEDKNFALGNRLDMGDKRHTLEDRKYIIGDGNHTLGDGRNILKDTSHILSHRNSALDLRGRKDIGNRKYTVGNERHSRQYERRTVENRKLTLGDERHNKNDREDNKKCLRSTKHILRDRRHAQGDKTCVQKYGKYIREVGSHTVGDKWHVVQDEWCPLGDRMHVLEDKKHILKERTYHRENKKHNQGDGRHTLGKGKRILDRKNNQRRERCPSNEKSHTLEDRSHAQGGERSTRVDRRHAQEGGRYNQGDKVSSSEEGWRTLRVRRHSAGDERRVLVDGGHILRARRHSLGGVIGGIGPTSIDVKYASRNETCVEADFQSVDSDGTLKNATLPLWFNRNDFELKTSADESNTTRHLQEQSHEVCLSFGEIFAGSFTKALNYSGIVERDFLNQVDSGNEGSIEDNTVVTGSEPYLSNASSQDYTSDKISIELSETELYQIEIDVTHLKRSLLLANGTPEIQNEDFFSEDLVVKFLVGADVTYPLQTPRPVMEFILNEKLLKKIGTCPNTFYTCFTRNGAVWSSKMSLDADKQGIVLSKFSKTQPPVGTKIFSYEDVWKYLAKTKSVTVFFDIADEHVDNGGKEPSCHDPHRIKIKITDSFALAHQFLLLCTGERGPAYKDGRVLIKQSCVHFANRVYNSRSSASSIITDVLTTSGRIAVVTEGLVFSVWTLKSGCTFKIFTKAPPGNKCVNRVLGVVTQGLAGLKQLTGTQVVENCGLVVSRQ